MTYKTSIKVALFLYIKKAMGLPGRPIACTTPNFHVPPLTIHAAIFGASSLYNTGVTIRVSSVELISPPMITSASGV